MFERLFQPLLAWGVGRFASGCTDMPMRLTREAVFPELACHLDGIDPDRFPPGLLIGRVVSLRRRPWA
jgi:hypothetical protein